MDEWLIWSIEHGAWWAHQSCGYTKKRAETARYTYEEACRIVEDANKSSDDRPDEAMVKA